MRQVIKRFFFSKRRRIRLLRRSYSQIIWCERKSALQQNVKYHQGRWLCSRDKSCLIVNLIKNVVMRRDELWLAVTLFDWYCDLSQRPTGSVSHWRSDVCDYQSSNVSYAWNVWYVHVRAKFCLKIRMWTKLNIFQSLKVFPKVVFWQRIKTVMYAKW